MILHSHTSKAGLLGRIAAHLTGVPIIVHTFHGLVLKGHYGPLKTNVARAVERWLARFSDRLIAVGDEDKKDLLAYGIAPSHKIDVFWTSWTILLTIENGAACCTTSWA